MALPIEFLSKLNVRARLHVKESLAANLLLCTDERIVIARLFVSQDPQETKKLGMNLSSH